MKLKTLISGSLLYGVADMAVLLVSGFILLPLYTRALSQAEFGIYVVVRANTEVLSYLLYLGVPSAMARLYFDHRVTEEHVDYVGTVCLGFAGVVLLGTLLALLAGDRVWALAAPQAPAWPFLWFSFGSAALSFYSVIGLTWLRLDEAIRQVMTLQFVTALLLAVFAWLALIVFSAGLTGLFTILLLVNLPAALVLVRNLLLRFKRPLPISTLTATLALGLPILLSYLSSFVLNRINLFIMQHWSDLETIAIYGLASQIASLVTVVSISFSKAVQPIIFRSDFEGLRDILARAMPVHIGIVTLATACLVLFLDDLLQIIAPKSYVAAYDITLMLAVANLVGSFSLISDTTLMYLKKPQLSLVVVLISGICSMLIGLALVPYFGAIGACVAVLIALACKTLAAQIIANRFVAAGGVWLVTRASLSIAAFAFAVRWLHGMELTIMASLGIKLLGIAALVGLAALLFYSKLKTAVTHTRSRQ